MAGRHRACADRTLGSGLGRVSALLLLTAAPLGYAGIASGADGSSTPVPERRAQAEEPEHDGGGGDRQRERTSGSDARDDDTDDTDDRGSGGRHRAADSSAGRHRAVRYSDTDSDSDSDSADESDDDANVSSPTRRATASRATGRTRDAGARTADSTVRRPATGASRRPGTTERATTTRRPATTERATTTRRPATTERATATTTGRPATTEQPATGRAQEARWDRLAQCESHQRWSANTGNGYRGGLQFSDSTWRAYGGGQYAPSAHQASREEQIAVAEKVRRDQGWSAWPACSRQLGYA